MILIVVLVIELGVLLDLVVVLVQIDDRNSASFWYFTPLSLVSPARPSSCLTHPFS